MRSRAAGAGAVRILPRMHPVFRLATLGALALAAALAAPADRHAQAAAADPLAAELARWQAFAATDTASDAGSRQVIASARPALAQAADALAHDRRGYALLRLSAARTLLAALVYTREHAGAAASLPALEAEWRRLEPELRAASPAAAGGSLAGLRPAAVRAVAEAALPQVRVYHDASLEYGRATDASAGLFYLGEAVAQREFVAFARTLDGGSAAAREPAFRALGPEIDALQAEMLAVYRPPVSIDRHPEFIAASAALKEARELDGAGLARGALLRYLQATLRFQPLRPQPPAFDAAATPAALAAFATRLAEAGVDHSLGRVFLEAAEGDLADTAAAAKHAVAAAVAAEVLPRYFAALAPAPPRAAAGPPAVTVTLVRWPYT